MSSLHVLLVFLMSPQFGDVSLVWYRNSLDFYALLGVLMCDGIALFCCES